MAVSYILLTILIITNFRNCNSFNFDLDFVDIIKSDISNSYFGYSVLLQKGLANASSRVLVGAPKANSSYPNHFRIKQPGSLYGCNLEKPNFCKQYVIDTEGNTESRGVDITYSYKNRKDYGLLGAAVDGGETVGDPFVICSPRWINDRRDRNGQHYLANGLCYWIDNSNNINGTGEKLIPLLHSGKQGYTLEQVKYYYAIGEAGMSVQYLSKEKELLMGAPGVLSWKGTVIRYRTMDRNHILQEQGLVGTRRKRSPFSRFIVPNPVYMWSVREENSYFGYAISHGIFDLRNPIMWYIAGAPRSEELNGLVLLFEYDYNEDSDLLVHKQLIGEQMGSYFGSALLSVDVTGKGVSDLLVGAPTYFIEKWDEGCVYFYKNTGTGNFEEPFKIFGNKQVGARFGSAISNLGDINHDSYRDVAISAPYEEGQGVIYIYLGNNNGLNRDYSQRIAAKTIDTSLKGFGFTISKAVDIDQNLYNDIAVGAYKSGQVAIIKTRPVIKYSARLTPSMKELSVNTTTFNVTFCINYASTTSGAMNVDTFINIVKDSRTINNNNVTQIIRLSQGNDFCGSIRLMLHGGHSDYSKPFTVEMYYGIADNRQSNFCRTCPVTDPTDRKSALLNVPFANGCGNDNICQPDLKIAVSVDDNLTSLVVGSRTTLKLKIRVENKNEPAYLCQVRMQLPANVEIERISSKCDLNEDRVYRCLVDNALQPDTHKSLMFDLDIKKINPNDKQLSLNITVDSKGEEIRLDDNSILITLPLLIENHIELSGASFPDQFVYVDEENNIKNEVVDFEHIYTIKNLGPSPMSQLNVNFYFPIEIKEDEIAFNVYEPVVHINNQLITCVTDYHLGFFADDTINIKTNTDNKESTEIPSRLRRSASTQSIQTLYDLPVNRTVFVNCTNSAFKCMKIACTNKETIHRNQYLQARIRVKAYINVLKQILNNKDIIFVSSTVETNANNRTTQSYASTLLIGSLTKQEVSYWIYIVCIVVGLIILAILAFVLYKLNFFNRPVREKLKDESDGSSVKKDLDDDDHDYDNEDQTDNVK